MCEYINWSRNRSAHWRTRPRLKFTLSMSHSGGVSRLFCATMFTSLSERRDPASVPVHRKKHSCVLWAGVVLSARWSGPANPAKNATRPHCVFLVTVRWTFTRGLLSTSADETLILKRVCVFRVEYLELRHLADCYLVYVWNCRIAVNLMRPCNCNIRTRADLMKWLHLLIADQFCKYKSMN